ncbi:hypothetical protein K525DRAFT_279147 [Schizophyllum commune Loenen D]|nr:hypothetical protein K525DRAFT_279147 [Schizophyllum commune Loenen D]
MPCRYSGLARLPACRAGSASYGRHGAKLARLPTHARTRSRAYSDQAASQETLPSQKAEPKAAPISKELAFAIHANAPYRTLITKAEALVLDVLPTVQTTEGSAEFHRFWRHLLEHSRSGLEGVEKELREGTPPAQLNILVCGLGDDSGARELVTALTEEPFSSNTTTARWDEVDAGARQFETQLDEVPKLVVTAPWLSALNAQILELRDPLQAKTLLSAFKADIPIIVRNPVTTPSSNIPLPTHNPLRLFIANAPPRGPLPDHPTTLAVDTRRAATALTTLNANPTSPTAVQLYQHDFAASNIPAVFEAIRARVSGLGPARRDARRTYAQGVLLGALNACREALAAARAECDAVEDRVSALERRAEEYKVTVPRTVLQDGKHVRRALEHTERRMGEVLDRLTWWRMVARVDEVSVVVADAVERLWCQELEQHLIYHTGQLAAARADLTTRALSAIETAGPAFASALLRNELDALAGAPSTTLSPSVLTAPVHARRAQMTHYATPRLHRSAQRSFLVAVGGAGLGTGTAIASSFASLGVAEGVLSNLLSAGVTPGTAAGAGVLLALASVRVAIGRWEKAKRRWWGDWKRVSEGLERDLSTTLDTVLRERVCAIPDAACKGLLRRVEQRHETIDVQEETLRSLEAEARTLETGKAEQS